MSQARIIENGVDEQFVRRWSPRAFAEATIEKQELSRFFEAARWAPSAYNSQPWRFLYSRNSDEYWSLFLDLLLPFNRAWAQHASALVIALSKTTFIPPGKSEAISTGSQSFDTGSAWTNFALQASSAGWHTHAMAGYDKDRARRELEIPQDHELEAVIAVGKLGDKSSQPPQLQEREQPSTRLPLSAIVTEGPFRFPG